MLHSLNLQIEELFMTNEDFQKLKKVINSQLTITDENVMTKSVQISVIYADLMEIWSKELRELKNISHRKDKIYGDLYHHYKFKFNYQLDSAKEIDNYVKADDKYYQVALEYSNQEVIVKYLEQTLTHINNLGFRITSYVEMKKMKKGII
jgi:hypothetical protein